MIVEGYKGKIVHVVKKSRLKWRPAPENIKGYVVSAYTNSWGTEKLVIIDLAGTEYCTTLNCIKLASHQDNSLFKPALRKWITDTHVPVVFETTIVPSNPVKKAICCRFINKKEESWVPLSVIKDENCNQVSLTSYEVNQCYSGYIPLWTAKKVGLVTPS